MTVLSLDQAQAIIAGALDKARELELKPLTVAVLDPGGHLIAFAKQDNSSLLRQQIALGKAAGALGLGISSRTIGNVAADRPLFIAAVGTMSPNGLVPGPGGVIVDDGSGGVAGAVGISGDTGDNDETCVLAGIAAAGLSPLN